MAATKGFTAKGTVLSVGTPGTGETFTPVMQVKSLQWTAPKTTYEDVTCLSSPTVGVMAQQEFMPTLVNPGEMTAQGIYLPSDSGLAALDTAFTAGTVVDFKVQLPPDTAGGQTTTGNMFAFSGFVQEKPLPDGLSVDKVITYKLSIKINTIIAVTPGS